MLSVARGTMALMTVNLIQAEGDADGRVAELAQQIAERLGCEPDLDDFLAWTAGTLEYWIHIVASSVAARRGWASRTEVPYVTAAPNPGTKSNIKWADGAMLLDDLGVLLEVKTIAAREHVVGPTLRKVPQDFAALAALDWTATVGQVPDQYSGTVWADRRAAMGRVALLQLALIHAPQGQLPLGDTVPTTVRMAATGVCRRLKEQGLTGAADLVDRTFAGEPAKWRLSGTSHEGHLYAWSAQGLVKAAD